MKNIREHQQNAKKRKLFLRRVGGGFLPDDLLVFSPNEMYQYGEGYKIDSSVKNIGIQVYEECSYDLGKMRKREVPRKILIDGIVYSVSYTKVKKPEIQGLEIKTS